MTTGKSEGSLRIGIILAAFLPLPECNRRPGDPRPSFARPRQAGIYFWLAARYHLTPLAPTQLGAFVVRTDRAHSEQRIQVAESRREIGRGSRRQLAACALVQGSVFSSGCGCSQTGRSALLLSESFFHRSYKRRHALHSFFSTVPYQIPYDPLSCLVSNSTTHPPPRPTLPHCLWVEHPGVARPMAVGSSKSKPQPSRRRHWTVLPAICTQAQRR